MAERYKKPPALKHGAYSAIGLLPGENRDEFEKLHDELINDYKPVGRHEQCIIETVARLNWRKQNLTIYRSADAARRAFSKIQAEALPKPDPFRNGDFRSAEEIRQTGKKTEERIREELDWATELLEAGDLLTLEYLMKELSVVDRIDAMIERLLKQLVLVKGVKSLSSQPAASSRYIESNSLGHPRAD